MKDKFAVLPVAELLQGENIRFELSEIQELATDIRNHGVLQPLVVIPSENGEAAEVLIGHRRLAAAKVAGLTEVPCVLRPRENDVTRMLAQVSENSMRVNLTPIEEGRCCAALVERGLDRAVIAKHMQKSDTWVTNRLRLLDLPQVLQDAVHEQRVTATRALDIAPHLRDPVSVERLERHLQVGGDGVAGWWRETYALREQARESVTPQREVMPRAEKAPTVYRICVNMPSEAYQILEALARASSVFHGPADVIAGFMESGLLQARDEMRFGEGWELETLRYCGGMTKEECGAYDARE